MEWIVTVVGNLPWVEEISLNTELFWYLFFVDEIVKNCRSMLMKQWSAVIFCWMVWWEYAAIIFEVWIALKSVSSDLQLLFLRLVCSQLGNSISSYRKVNIGVTIVYVSMLKKGVIGDVSFEN